MGTAVTARTRRISAAIPGVVPGGEPHGRVDDDCGHVRVGREVRQRTW